MNQFIASAASEKMASVLALEFLRAEAAKGNKSDFDHYLGMAPDVPAHAGDERSRLNTCGAKTAILECYLPRMDALFEEIFAKNCHFCAAGIGETI